MSEMNEIIKRQFDSQAQNFSAWSVTKNTEYQDAYFDFCGLSEQDTFLDFACGTGDYVIAAANRVEYAYGIDISEGMIGIAGEQAQKAGVKNAGFLCRPVEDTPFENETFSIVSCRSAFHHFHDYEGIIDEMIRCCKKGGRIGIQDIAAYPDDKIDSFFEQLEKQIDISHNKTVSKAFITDLFNQKGIEVTRTFDIRIDLNFQDYLGHARQSEQSRSEIRKLLETGLEDPRISEFFFVRDQDLFFKRDVFVILGTKPL